MKPSKLAANLIMKDILGRKGIGNEMEQVDSDTQREILTEWETIIEKTIKESIRQYQVSQSND
jgi:hypothetical protein